MFDFNLSVQQYAIAELEDLLSLRPGKYNAHEVAQKCDALIRDIRAKTSVPSTTQATVSSFLQDVKRVLSDHLNTTVNSLQAIYNTDKSLQPSALLSAGSTQIIQRPPTPYGQSSPSEFYEGTLNPLNKRILRQNINIDTRFRTSYYTTMASNFHLDLPLKLSQVVSLQLSAMEMPSTFYVVSQVFGNNFFSIDIPDEPRLTITLPDGNYDYLGLQQWLNNYLSTQAPPAFQTIQFLADGNTPAGAGPTGGSGKMVVGSTTGSTVFSLQFAADRYGNPDAQTPLPLKLGWLMGFRGGAYENSLAYVSEGIVNLAGPRYIYLVVDDYNNSVLDGFYGAFTSSVLNKNILARISLQGNVFNWLSKDNFGLISTPRQYFGPVDIQKLHIQLLDEYGRVLNLNNMDYSFCLSFQTVYNL